MTSILSKYVRPEERLPTVTGRSFVLRKKMTSRMELSAGTLYLCGGNNSDKFGCPYYWEGLRWMWNSVPCAGAGVKGALLLRVEVSEKGDLSAASLGEVPCLYTFQGKGDGWSALPRDAGITLHPGYVLAFGGPSGFILNDLVIYVSDKSTTILMEQRNGATYPVELQLATRSMTTPTGAHMSIGSIYVMHSQCGRIDVTVNPGTPTAFTFCSGLILEADVAALKSDCAENGIAVKEGGHIFERKSVKPFDPCTIGNLRDARNTLHVHQASVVRYTSHPALDGPRIITDKAKQVIYTPVDRLGVRLHAMAMKKIRAAAERKGAVFDVWITETPPGVQFVVAFFATPAARKALQKRTIELDLGCNRLFGFTLSSVCPESLSISDRVFKAQLQPKNIIQKHLEKEKIEIKPVDRAAPSHVQPVRRVAPSRVPAHCTLVPAPAPRTPASTPAELPPPKVLPAVEELPTVEEPRPPKRTLSTILNPPHGKMRRRALPAYDPNDLFGYGANMPHGHVDIWTSQKSSREVTYGSKGDKPLRDLVRDVSGLKASDPLGKVVGLTLMVGCFLGGAGTRYMQRGDLKTKCTVGKFCANGHTSLRERALLFKYLSPMIGAQTRITRDMKVYVRLPNTVDTSESVYVPKDLPRSCVAYNHMCEYLLEVGSPLDVDHILTKMPPTVRSQSLPERGLGYAPSAAVDVVGVIGKGGCSSVNEVILRGSRYALKSCFGDDRQLMAEVDVLMKHTQLLTPRLFPRFAGAAVCGNVGLILMEILPFTADTVTCVYGDENKVPLRESLFIMRSVAEALTIFHERMKMIHRDIKPHNILIDCRGRRITRVLLTDFGLAMSCKSGKPREGNTCTDAYAPPEIIFNGKVYKKSDVYSLGVSIVELLTDVILELKEDVEPPLPEAVPNSIAPVLTKCLHHQIRKRGTASDIVGLIDSLPSSLSVY